MTASSVPNRRRVGRRPSAITSTLLAAPSRTQSRGRRNETVWPRPRVPAYSTGPRLEPARTSSQESPAEAFTQRLATPRGSDECAGRAARRAVRTPAEPATEEPVAAFACLARSGRGADTCAAGSLETLGAPVRPRRPTTTGNAIAAATTGIMTRLSRTSLRFGHPWPTVSPFRSRASSSRTNESASSFSDAAYARSTHLAVASSGMRSKRSHSRARRYFVLTLVCCSTSRSSTPCRNRTSRRCAPRACVTAGPPPPREPTGSQARVWLPGRTASLPLDRRGARHAAARRS